jgi:DNA-binding LacI/PurR family transcriptional regulator/biotin operon repressor
MKIDEKSQNTVTAILEYALVSPASRVGRRLKSESELGTLLKVGRWRVRKSIDELEEKGLLARRHGSGTYVQKIPDTNGSYTSFSKDNTDLIPPESLFTDPSNTTEILQHEVASKRYTIGLWSDLHCTSVLNQRIMADLVKAISEAGHALTVHSVVEGIDRPYSAEKLTSLLRNNPCDGYLCFDRWSDLFMQSLGLQTKPVLFFALANSFSQDKPVVMIDTFMALRRGIRTLAKEGYRRIAMIGLRNTGRVGVPDTEAEIYEQALTTCGLDYRNITWVNTSGVSEVISATKKMFNSENRPDAVYVADDYIMTGFVEALKILDVTPGKDVGLITLGNNSHELPSGKNWSRMEIDLGDFVGVMVDYILRCITKNKPAHSPVSLIPAWIPGETHSKTN